MRNALLQAEAEECFERLSIRLDAIGPEILAKHFAGAARGVRIPRQWKVRDHHVADARNAAILGLLQGAIEVHRHPRMPLIERPLDGDEMHDRENSRASEILGL